MRPSKRRPSLRRPLSVLPPRKRCEFCGRVLDDRYVFQGRGFCQKADCKRARKGLVPA